LEWILCRAGGIVVIKGSGGIVGTKRSGGIVVIKGSAVF